MGIETALMVSAGIGAVSSIAGGMSQNREAKRQAAQVEEQGLIDAQQEMDNANRAARVQKMQFIKSGVLLSGTPLQVMSETYDRGRKNADNIMKTAGSRAKTLRKAGTNALWGGVAGAAQSAGSAFLKGYDLGWFGSGSSGSEALVNTASNPGYSGAQYDANNAFFGNLMGA